MKAKNGRNSAGSGSSVRFLYSVLKDICRIVI